MTIECIPLFPSNLFKTHIDPSTFNKSEIIDTVLRNYDLQKQRNEWDKLSKMHHYYNDWNNELFEKVDLSVVTTIYKDIYKNILDSAFNKPVEFNVSMENITVHKGNDNHMSTHNHVNDYVYLSGVHYIKCDEKSSKLTFINPLKYSEYPNLTVKNVVIDTLNKSDPINSSYYSEWNCDVTQDEMMIFPAYLNHRVYPSQFEDSDFRIAIVTNLQVFSATKESL
jgi:hypothetical protein